MRILYLSLIHHLPGGLWFFNSREYCNGNSNTNRYTDFHTNAYRNPNTNSKANHDSPFLPSLHKATSLLKWRLKTQKH